MAQKGKTQLFQRWIDERAEPIWIRPEFIAAFIAILSYVNTLPNDYTDDGVPIVALNPMVNEPGKWLELWTHDHWFESRGAAPMRDLLYRPWPLMTYRLIRQSLGPDPFPQLLANVLLHALVTVLIVRFTRHVKGDYASALTAGAIFATLPIHTEVIDNVVGRADLLATAGIVGGILLHRRSMIATTKEWILSWRILAAFALFSALAAKESAVTAPILVVLFDKLWYQSWRAASRDRKWWSVAGLWRLTYLVIPVAAYLALRAYALDGRLVQEEALSKTVNVLVDAPAFQRVLGTFQLFGMYWAKTIWPAVLSVNYTVNDIRLATSWTDFNVILGFLVTAGLVAASVAAWRRGNRAVAFLFAALLISYFPVSNSFVLIQVFFAERNWYLPSVWVVILVGLAASGAVKRPLWFTIGCVVVFAMAARCWVRNAEWRDNRTLYAATYETHRRSVGALRLHGNELVREGKFAEGIKLLKQAVEIDQGFTDAHRSLGFAYYMIGDYANAVYHLQIANMQIPEHRETVELLTAAKEKLAAQSKSELRQAQLAVQESPDDVSAELNLVNTLLALGKLDEALVRFQQNEERFGNSADWQSQYAVALVYKNDREAAIQRYRKALSLAPDRVSLLVELASLLVERDGPGDMDEAWDLSSKALTLAPQEPTVLVCRAELLYRRGDLPGAVELYDMAIDALPPGNFQRRLYEERAKVLGQ
ncbi:MAG: tetratricopeptide repeat protein [Phycisphaerae bacterium]|nr:tetratricopeptide repeat protein [Phycisphaerae bacterium]